MKNKKDKYRILDAIAKSGPNHGYDFHSAMIEKDWSDIKDVEFQSLLKAYKILAEALEDYIDEHPDDDQNYN